VGRLVRLKLGLEVQVSLVRFLRDQVPVVDMVVDLGSQSRRCSLSMG
jgi:hypothetical protein